VLTQFSFVTLDTFGRVKQTLAYEQEHGNILTLVPQTFLREDLWLIDCNSFGRVGLDFFVPNSS
jgi:hypothetical protein